MKLIRINTNPSRKDLKLFGIVWLAFSLLILGGLIWKEASVSMLSAWIAFGIAGPLIGWIYPPFMRIAYVGMAFAAYPIGLVVSHLILAIIYYLILTPTGILLRLFKSDFFPKRPDSRLDTYWIATSERKDPKRYFKQY